jgi:hypothetical protein
MRKDGDHLVGTNDTISAGEVITWSPPTCLTGKCPSGMPPTTMIGDKAALEAVLVPVSSVPGQMSLRAGAWYGAPFNTACHGCTKPGCGPAWTAVRWVETAARWSMPERQWR